jgi:predicted amidophosphoribosyltransferase
MLLDDILGVFASVRCISCRARGPMLCGTCAPPIAPDPTDLKLAGVTRCGAPWRYEGHARDLVLALKLRGRRAAAEPLAAAIVGWLPDPPAVVTWVPGRRADIRRRGFDHAEAIARAVAAHYQVGARALLRRISAAPDQTTLSRAQRLSNLGHVFAAAGSPLEVLLVDDLVTTGATLNACATALKRAGARRITAVAACRA